MSAHVEPHLLPFLRGELSAPETVAVQTHLEGCAGCRATVEDFRRIASELAGSAPEPPPIHWGAYRAELRARIERRSSSWGWGWVGAATPLRAALGGGLIAILVYLSGAGHIGRPPSTGVDAGLDEVILTGEPDLVARLDLIQRLDLLEDLEVIGRLDRLPANGDG